MISRTYESPVGELLLVGDGDDTLHGLYFPGHKPAPRFLAPPQPSGTAFANVVQQLDEWFASERIVFDVPIALNGNPFQLAVWKELQNIPHGTTVTYGALATAVGRPGAARAIGTCVGSNPISIIVPCHRVIGSTGKITGYAGGVERKQTLLDLESPTLSLLRS